MTKSIHYHERGWDVVACGLAGPKIMKTDHAASVGCKRCLKSKYFPKQKEQGK